MKNYNYNELICRSCGEHFDRSEAATMHDEAVCPFCLSSDIDDAAICECCGEWFAESDLIDGFCNECIDEKATASNILDYCEDEKTDVEINFGAVSILKALGVDINRLVIGYAVDMAKYFPDKVRVLEALQSCVKSELDVQAFMEGVTA